MKVKNIKFYALEHGKDFTPALMKDIPRMPLGRCFDNSIIVALKSSFSYCEGVAFNIQLQKWQYHAWVTDGKQAFDPTWQAFDKDGKEIAIPTRYVGFIFNNKKVIEFMKKTGYQGVIANQWRAQGLANKILLNK